MASFDSGAFDVNAFSTSAFDIEEVAGAMYGTASGTSGASAVLGFTVAPEVIDAEVMPSGGFAYPLDGLHTQSHVSKSVRKLIKRIAKKQVEEQIEEIETAESQAFVQQLMTALAKADLQYKAFYAEILEQERQRLIDDEIKQLMGIKRMMDEEEEVLAVLMAMM